MSQGSLCLYDDWEELWPLKLHLGCGGVYLSNYTNIDMAGRIGTPDPEYISRIENYYAGLYGDADHLPTRRETVADMLADIARLPYPESSVDKIVAIQVFEHFAPAEAIIAIQHWHSLLWRRQPLVMSVPDMDGTLDLLETDFAFALRHLRGRQGDYYNMHHAWYTQSGLCGLLEWAGFDVDILPNFHFYPAICVRARKQ